MNPNVFDSLLELLGLGAKVVVSQSELKPTTKEGFHFAIDMIKKFSSEINRQVETQKIRKFLDELIAHAKVCDIDRLELILLEGNRCEPLFLAFGGDVQRFFQCLNSPFISLQDKYARSWPVAQLGARSVMLRIPLPEYADGPLNLCKSTASVGHAKTRREARLTPSETD